MSSYLFIVNTNNPYGGGADHIVHAADCQDRQCKNAAKQDKIVIEAETLQEAEGKFRAMWYGDFDEETQWMFGSDIKPCAR